MKTKSITIASFLTICLFVLTSMTTTQETTVFEGIFDGQEDYGYNFIGVNEDDDEYTMTFQNVDETVFKSFDLKSNKLVGSKFSVTYTTKIEKETDEEGYEDDVEIYTIIALKKL
jgi:hypothetical protein|nr:hypothetical protein [uncultured Psychroserpens sp.]